MAISGDIPAFSLTTFIERLASHPKDFCGCGDAQAERLKTVSPDDAAGMDGLL